MWNESLGTCDGFFDSGAIVCYYLLIGVMLEWIGMGRCGSPKSRIQTKPKDPKVPKAKAKESHKPNTRVFVFASASCS